MTKSNKLVLLFSIYSIGYGFIDIQKFITKTDILFYEHNAWVTRFLSSFFSSIIYILTVTSGHKPKILLIGILTSPINTFIPIILAAQIHLYLDSDNILPIISFEISQYFLLIFHNI
jgi:hypothetical protein